MSDTFTVEAGEPLEVTVEHCGTPDAEVVVTVGQMPESHAATHAAGGIDPLQITSQQITDFTTAAVDAVTWITITGKPSTFAPSAHAHPISDVIGLQSALDAKATPADVSSAVAAVVNAAPATLDTLNELAAALGNDANFATTVTNALAAKAPLASPTFTGTVSGVTKAMVGLGNVQNVDATARANHTGTQTASTISDFTAAVIAAAPPTTNASLLTSGTLADARLSGNVVLTNDARLSDARTPLAHTHTIADVTGLQASLDGKQAVGSYAAAVHTHVIADVTGLQTALDGKQAAGSYAAATHAHAIADVSGLQTALDGKASLSHAHSATDITSATFDIARLPVGTSSTTVAAGNDARFSDQRVPTDGSVTDAKITSGGLSASSLNWAAIQPWAANTAYAKGDLVSFQGIAYRRSAAGTSGATFNVANWQQITPSEFVASQITSGTISAARLGSGTPSASNYLRGDGEWSTITASSAAVYVFTRSSKPADATGSNGSYSWSLPAGAKLVEIFAIGSGGGGGSGRRGAAGTARWGGGGGAAANATLVTIPASLITTALDVVISAGGAGGAGVTADDTNGNAGTNGGSTTVAFNGVAYVRGIGGPGGGGGTATSGGGGQVNNTDMRTFSGGNGAASSATGNGNGAFPATGNAGIGGAGGGGISTGNVAYSGGTQWNPPSLAAVVAAGAGTLQGGAASTTAAAGAGANAPTYGYGGCGGGASANGFASGAGGNGGDGYVRITVWF